MSRFFEALKEASRSNPDLSESVANGYPPAPTVSHSDPPPASMQGLDAAPVTWPDPPRSASAPKPEVSYNPPEPLETAEVEPPFRTAPALDTEAMFDHFAPRRNGYSGGRKMEITLDPKAPLIPNANGDLVLERYRRLRTKVQQLH